MKHIPVGNFTSTPRMKTLINEVLDSGIISYGEKSKAFEQQFAALHGARYAALSNSGTSSLLVALQAMKDLHRWQSREVVLVPATTFIATANIVRHAGMSVHFVDVDSDTWVMDREIIGEVNPYVQAVIPVHLLGLPANVDGIRRYLAHIDREDVKILEDSCEAMFATHYGDPVGSLGDIAAFSTYVAHILVTGVGGLTLTSNPTYAGKVRSLLNHGLALYELNPDDNFSPRPMLGRRFLFEGYGHSFRLTEMEAALGLAQLETYQEALEKRRTLAAHYETRLGVLNQRYDGIFAMQHTPSYDTHARMMFGIALEKPQPGQRAKQGSRKESVRNWLSQHGVETRDLPTCMGQPLYDLDPMAFRVSDWLWRHGFYVGCHAGLTLDDVDYVCDTLEAWLRK